MRDRVTMLRRELEASARRQEVFDRKLREARSNAQGEESFRVKLEAELKDAVQAEMGDAAEAAE